MNPSLVWKLLRKDLAVGPRSAVFLWAVVMPFALTLILQVAFGSLFDPEPRLGVVDRGNSSLTAAVRAMDGLTVTVFDDEAELRDRVEANDLDAGIVLPPGFDEAVRSGAKPELQFWIGGESHAANRIILTVAAIDLVREIEGGQAPVVVEVVSVGVEGLPISTRLIPLIVFFALVMIFATVKGMGIFLFAPAMFYIFPDWPQWIAMLFPLYWIIEPIWQVSVMGEPLATVAPNSVSRWGSPPHSAWQRSSSPAGCPSSSRGREARKRPSVGLLRTSRLPADGQGTRRVNRSIRLAAYTAMIRAASQASRKRLPRVV